MARLRFGEAVPPGGYLWWYLDGVSADGAHAITIIAFIGSVFSPYYAWSGRHDPLNHVAFNVALYGGRRRWAMTERGRRRAVRSDSGFAVGRSRLEFDGDGLSIEVDERCAPLPRRVRGRVRVRPEALCPGPHAIDSGGAHRWHPLAPAAPIEVEMVEPALSWRGTGYLDMNWGDRALEETFAQWDWMRVDLGAGRSAICYETRERGGVDRRLALHSRPDGTVETIEPMPRHGLPRTLWGMPRTGWAQSGTPSVRRTLEDTPFYVRSELATTVMGGERTAIHETLSLSRFRQPIVKLMLPFRMPRLP